MPKDSDKPSLKRTTHKDEEEEGKKEEAISSPIDRVIDLAFNPSREKIREVTIVDRIQGRLFPLLDMVMKGQQYILETAVYRQSAEEYKKIFKQTRPIAPNFLDELMFRTAQWQKSVAGKNLERAIDIALAETETRTADEGDVFGKGADGYSD